MIIRLVNANDLIGCGGTLSQSDLCKEVHGGVHGGVQGGVHGGVHGGTQRCTEVCTEVHRGGGKNQDFMIIGLVNTNDLIGCGGDT